MATTNRQVGDLMVAAAAQLRALLDAQQMTVEQLADRAGVPVRVVEDGLAGRRLTVDVFAVTCTSLGVAPSSVMKGLEPGGAVTRGTPADTAPCPAWCTGDHDEPLEYPLPGGPTHTSRPVLVDSGVGEHAIDVVLTAGVDEDGQAWKTLRIDKSVNVSLEQAPQLADAIRAVHELHRRRFRAAIAPCP